MHTAGHAAVQSDSNQKTVLFWNILMCIDKKVGKKRCMYRGVEATEQDSALAVVMC